MKAPIYSSSGFFKTKIGARTIGVDSVSHLHLVKYLRDTWIVKKYVDNEGFYLVARIQDITMGDWRLKKEHKFSGYPANKN